MTKSTAMSKVVFYIIRISFFILSTFFGPSNSFASLFFLFPSHSNFCTPKKHFFDSIQGCEQERESEVEETFGSATRAEYWFKGNQSCNEATRSKDATW